MKRRTGNLLTALLLCLAGGNAVVPARAQARIDSSFKLEFVHSPLSNMQTERIEGIGNILVTPTGKMLVGQWAEVRDYFGKEVRSFYGLFRYNQDGTLDKTLNDSGCVPLPPDIFDYGLFLRQDWMLYYGLGYSHGMRVSRFRPDLLLDSSYGINGSTSNSSIYLANVGACIFDVRGRILAATEPFGVLCLTEKGYIDSSFGNNSFTRPNINDGYVSRLAGLPDGKILLCGPGYPNNYSVFTLVRVTEKGVVDSSFGKNGVVYTDFQTRYDVPHDMAVQPDGKIVMVGQAGYDLLAIARYLPDGRLDTTFNHTGMLTVDNNGLPLRGVQLILMPNGKMLVGCRAYLTSSGKDQNLAVFRCNPNGTPDSTFAPNGLFVVDFGLNDEFQCIALQPNGGILLAGNSEDDADWQNPKYYRDLVRIVVKEKEVPPTDGPFIISPNPFTAAIHIQASVPGTLRFINAIGQVTGTYPVAAGQSDLMPLFGPGFYIWSFTTSDGIRKTGTIIHY